MLLHYYSFSDFGLAASQRKDNYCCDSIFWIFETKQNASMSCKCIGVSIMTSFHFSVLYLLQGVGETLGAADVALLLETVGVDRVISIDLHEGQIEGILTRDYKSIAVQTFIFVFLSIHINPGFFPPYIPVENLEPYLVCLRSGKRIMFMIYPAFSLFFNTGRCSLFCFKKSARSCHSGPLGSGCGPSYQVS